MVSPTEHLPVFLLGISLSLAVAWAIGANDAANSTKCVVGGGVIPMRRALLLFSVFVAVGAMVQGHMVMKTISRGVVPEIDSLGAFTTVLAIVLWLVFCTWRGLPVSTTHTTVGAVVGYGLIAYSGSLNGSVVFKVFMGIVSSPLASMVLGAIFYILVVKFLFKGSGRLMSLLARWLLIAASCFSAYSFGANDVGNATGVYVVVTERVTGLPGSSTMLMLAALGSFGIALGGFMWGYRVIETVGFRITRLDLATGLSAELANALSVWAFTTIPYLLFGFGLPISTTHSSVGAIIGVGLVRGARGVNLKTVVSILSGWVFTIPSAALLSALLFTAAKLTLG